MSTAIPAPQTPNPQRILACLLCQQRKVKCSRSFPCTNCIKQQVHCVPATAPRRRRRRFPERELLERLRKYEDLMRQNGVKFDPLHPETGVEKESSDSDEDGGSNARKTENSETKPQPPDFLSSQFRENVLSTSWDHSMDNEDNILFGSRQTFVHLSSLHPPPTHIFKLWQVYLDNVSPLLRVTHTPSLQSRITQVAGTLFSVDASLEALMFSIYCISVTSLEPEDCLAMFGSLREDMLMRFRFGCQQALMNAAFLQTEDLDTLTALYLYLLSTYATVHARSLDSMLGIAIRIAQRLRIHDEAQNSQCTVFEAEMRRRLWWALVLLDSRVSSVANSVSSTLVPTWDCKVPANIGDAELRPDMVEAPLVQDYPSDAIFAVVRCEIGEYIRHSPLHIDLTNTRLSVLAKHSLANGSLTEVEKLVEKYVVSCKEGNPVHFMTIWANRAQLAKLHLVEHCVRPAAAPEEQCHTNTMNQALRLLHCDTTLMTAPSAKAYHWFLRQHLPFVAYIHIMQHLQARSNNGDNDWPRIEEAWIALNDNFVARFSTANACSGTHFKAFTNLVLGSWETMEAKYRDGGKTTPELVLTVRQRLADAALVGNLENSGAPPLDGGSNGDEFDLDGMCGGGLADLATDLDFANLDQAGFEGDISNVTSMEWK